MPKTLCWDVTRNTGTHSVAVIYVAHIIVNGHTCTTCIQRSHWHWRTEALEAGTPPWHRRSRNSRPTCKSRNKAGTGTDGSPVPSLLRLNGGSEASAVALACAVRLGCFPCVYSRDRRSAALLQLRVGDMEFQRELTGWHQLHIVCGEVCDHDSNAMQCIIIIMILYCPKLNDRPSCIPSITCRLSRSDRRNVGRCSASASGRMIGSGSSGSGIRTTVTRPGHRLFGYSMAFIGDHCMFC